MINQKLFPILVFVIFCTILIGATLYYAPGWGFMDDGNNLSLSNAFWANKNPAKGLKLLLDKDFHCGRFRPVYQLWIIFIYRMFALFPLGIYIFIIFVNMFILCIWGLVIHRAFLANKDMYYFDVFLYPLALFVFTPFWNNFMYISLQEKFVYIFNALSIFCYILGYGRNEVIYLALSWIFMITGFLGKETGISLSIAYIGTSLIDIVFIKENRRLSIIQLIANILIFAGYYLFIQMVFTQYSMSYKNNLSLSMIFTSILKSPILIQGLIVLAVIWVFVYLLNCRKKEISEGSGEFSRPLILKTLKHSEGDEGSRTLQSFGLQDESSWINKKKNSPRTQISNIKPIVFPFFFGAYILILAPWGFANYLLAPLAPMVLAMLYPAYSFLFNFRKITRLISIISLICIVGLFLWSIIIPRISKMGDKDKIVKFIKSLEKINEHNGKYFFPLPFEESAGYMNSYTGADVQYLYDGALSKEMLVPEKRNYLLFGDECLPVVLSEVKVGDEIYRNGTWRVFLVQEGKGQKSEFKCIFKKSFLEIIKDIAYKK